MDMHSSYEDSIFDKLSGILPTANTKAEYPSQIIFEEDIKLPGDKKSYGTTQLEAENKYSEPADGPETVYVVCEKMCFRADSFFNSLSKEFNAKLIYMNESKGTKLDTPICFIIDLNTALITTYAKQMLETLRKYSINRPIPLFLIGESEDILNAHRNIPFPANVSVYDFERPVDMKECVRQINEILNSDISAEERKHILVVDDSITFCRLIQRVLEKEYKVTVCTSAFNCICTIAKLPQFPDIIIIDQEMPDCDGTTLAKMLKGDSRTRDIPIIFYSSNNNTDDIIELMQVGIDNYLLKNEPVIKLREYLDDRFKPIEEEKKPEPKRIRI